MTDIPFRIMNNCVKLFNLGSTLIEKIVQVDHDTGYYIRADY